MPYPGVVISDPDIAFDIVSHNVSPLASTPRDPGAHSRGGAHDAGADPAVDGARVGAAIQPAVRTAGGRDHRERVVVRV